MLSAILALVASLFAAAVLTPLVRRFALHIGAVDDPRGARRVHSKKIPRLGGLAIVLAFFVPMLVLFGLNTQVALRFFAQPWRAVGLAVGGLTLMALGAWDDIRGVRAIHKLLVQLAVAGVAYACGFRIENLDLPLVGSASLGIFSLPVTLGWIVLIVNALNLVDGLDGLAAGVAFFACVTNFIVGYIGLSPNVMLLSAALGGSILGFLLYNFNPATIFMGDSGSLFLGYVLALVSIIGNATRASTTIAIIVPILALGLPIVDTLFAIARRWLERRPIFSPDRGHIHHRLVDLGLTQRRAVLILYGVSVLFCAVAVAVYLRRSLPVGLALLALTVALVGVVRFVGYFQYLHLRRRQKLLIHSPATEKLRKAVPGFIRRVDAADLEGIPVLLERLGTEGELVSLELVGDHSRIPPFKWDAADTPPSGGRDAVHARFPVPTPDGGPDLELSVTWLSDDGEVSASADILLQMVADAISHRLALVEARRRVVTTGHLRAVK